MKKGAVYQSFGKSYTDQAALSARSFKNSNPLLKTAIFTDDVNYAKEKYENCFDFIYPLVANDDDQKMIDNLKENKRLFAIKIMASYRSPFDQTLLIDSDTVILKDLSDAFDLLNDFDLMVCNEVEHYFEDDRGYYGIKCNRRKNFYNSGVMFFNSYSPAVQRFLRSWERIQREGDEVLQRSDQESLNHMIALPVEYMPDIRFSGSVLKSREYNAFCRYWREIYDTGLWDNVKIVHTYMSSKICEDINNDDFSWERFLSEKDSDFSIYINRFASGLGEADRKSYAKISARRNVSISQFRRSEITKTGISRAADLAPCFSMTPQDTGFDIVTPLMWIEKNKLIRERPLITQIGMLTSAPRLPMQSKSDFFSIGNDLEYLSEVFSAKTTGISRSQFLSFKSADCTVLHSMYEFEGNLEKSVPNNQDLIIDIDNSIIDEIRIKNILVLINHLSDNGILIIANIKRDAASRYYDRLSDHMGVINNGSYLILRRNSPALPAYIPTLSPFSVAQIALIGNCQASALASVLKRVKGINVCIIVDINAQGSEAYKHAHWAAAHDDRVDFCFSQALSAEFEDISSSRLSDKYGDRYKKYTNLYFSGFHPDLIYFGKRGLRVQSAMGDYNSRIALISYLQARSVDDTIKSFNKDVYQKLDYFNIFHSSKSELLSRDEANDIKFAELFFEISRQSVPLYTVNHPTASVLGPLAEMIVLTTGQTQSSIEISGIRNPLVEGSIWPIYPEVAEELKLNYAGSEVFYPNLNDERFPMSLRDFVGISFEEYEKFGRDRLLTIPGASDMARTEIL